MAYGSWRGCLSGGASEGLPRATTAGERASGLLSSPITGRICLPLSRPVCELCGPAGPQVTGERRTVSGWAFVSGRSPPAGRTEVEGRRFQWEMGSGRLVSQHWGDMWVTMVAWRRAEGRDKAHT